MKDVKVETACVLIQSIPYFSFFFYFGVDNRMCHVIVLLFFVCDIWKECHQSLDPV